MTRPQQARFTLDEQDVECGTDSGDAEHSATDAGVLADELNGALLREIGAAVALIEKAVDNFAKILVELTPGVLSGGCAKSCGGEAGATIRRDRIDDDALIAAVDMVARGQGAEVSRSVLLAAKRKGLLTSTGRGRASTLILTPEGEEILALLNAEEPSGDVQ